MAGEVRTAKTQEQEDREAADAIRDFAAAESRDKILKGGIAAKEVADAVLMRLAGRWGWKTVALAIAATAVAISGMFGVGMAVRPSTDEVKAVVKEAVKEAKVEAPAEPQADVAKLVATGFADQSKVLTSIAADIRKIVEKKPEPQPKPVGPDVPSPKPKLLVLQESATVAVGGVVRIKAAGPTPVEWSWRPSKDFTVERYGDVVLVESSAEGTLVLAAYISSGGKVPDFAVCVVSSKKPIPPVPTPPDPTPPQPSPKPPIPTPVQMDELGRLVLSQAVKPGRKEEALKMAAVYESVVAGIRAGRIKTVGDAVKELYRGNTSVLGDSTKYWAGFFAWADNELTRRAELGKLATMEQNALAFEQVGAALREASK